MPILKPLDAVGQETIIPVESRKKPLAKSIHDFRRGIFGNNGNIGNILRHPKRERFRKRSFMCIAKIAKINSKMISMCCRGDW